MFGLFQRRKSSTGPRRLWLDLGDLRDLIKRRGKQEQWQDHGLGLLRTILHQNGLMTDLASTRACATWDQVRRKLAGYDMLIMNVRSYTFPAAYRSARTFKELNPKGLVLTAGCTRPLPSTRCWRSRSSTRSARGPGRRSSSIWSAIQGRFRASSRDRAPSPWPTGR